MAEKFLSTAVIISIHEMKSEDTVDRSIFNDKGEVIAQMDDELFTRAKDAVKGKRVLFVEAQCGGKKAMYQSPHVEENNLSIANALATCLIPIAQSLVKQFRGEAVEEKRLISLG